MKRTRAFLALLCLMFYSTLFAQNGASRLQVSAARATDAIIIDGYLNEAVWRGTSFTAFKQRDPNQGEEPTEKTEVWVAYDDAALYIAARMYDSSPDSIMSVLGRRDDYVTADWFVAFIDSYYDKRNGFFFMVSAAGTLIDGTMYNDDWDDWSWDGVWEAGTTIDNQGWTAEFRIPYSQLRFHDQDKYTWGINFKREIGRKNETDYLAYTPRKESGFVSRFGDLVGIEKVTPPQRVEVLPYVNTRAEYSPRVDGNPFKDRSKYLPGMGADVKIGLGSNLTLDATINPDFGQVEVDPAVVNLSDVESYFEEKRPFFVEGANTFSFGRGGASSFWGFNSSIPTIFYSRRIGRAPQGRANGDYVDSPVGAHIIGAGKISGKVWDGWNVGMIHAVTAREFAQVQTAGVRSESEVEPASYYGIARLQRDFNDGKQGFGVISTFTNRFFDDQRLADQINGSALVTGVDGWTFLDTSKTYVVTGWLAASHITGTTKRILSLQQSSQHYFQRPDATHLDIDSSATSLTG
ncbi:MAG: carbohydrate binding family 9 domain-containing protein, partial [Nitrososphaera sp.]|nr:carbohydrate binding family 9 domain-containing protein [Nitrososphaera sp.]